MKLQVATSIGVPLDVQHVQCLRHNSLLVIEILIASFISKKLCYVNYDRIKILICSHHLRLYQKCIANSHYFQITLIEKIYLKTFTTLKTSCCESFGIIGWS